MHEAQPGGHGAAAGVLRARRPGRAAPAGPDVGDDGGGARRRQPPAAVPGSVTTPMSSCSAPTKNAVATATGRPSATATHAVPDAASPACPPQVSEIQAIDGSSAASPATSVDANRRTACRGRGRASSGSTAMIRSQTATGATDSSAGRHCGGASTSPRSPGTATGSPRHATLSPGSSATAVRGSSRRSARHRPTPEAATCCWISGPGRSGANSVATASGGTSCRVMRPVCGAGYRREGRRRRWTWRARPRRCPPSSSCCSARWSPSTTPGCSSPSSARRCAPWATCGRDARPRTSGPAVVVPGRRARCAADGTSRQHHPDAAGRPRPRAPGRVPPAM